MFRKSIITALSLTLLLSSCKKEDNNNVNSTLHKVNLNFENVFGDKPIILGDTYTNELGEDVQINMLKYFVSNVSFKKLDGTVYTIPQEQSYFLINQHRAASFTRELYLPEGTYTQMTFMLGVDSLRNTKDLSERTGELDPTDNAAGMYWGWNSGYIHFALEGKSTASTHPVQLVTYHIGGFGGYSTKTINNTKWVTIDLNTKGNVIVDGSKLSIIELATDINTFFTTPNSISIAFKSLIMEDYEAETIAENAQHMFSFKGTRYE